MPSIPCDNEGRGTQLVTLSLHRSLQAGAAKWTSVLDEAQKNDASAFKDKFTDGSTASIAALQSALVACRKGNHLRNSLDEAVKGGGDIVQTAAVVGALMGAYDGADTVPSAWVPELHGWLEHPEGPEFEWSRPHKQSEAIGNCVRAILKGSIGIKE